MWDRAVARALAVTSKAASPADLVPVGWSCLASFAVGVLGFIAMAVSVGSGQEGGETFTDNWWISGPALVSACGVIGAFATGLFAIVGMRERAVPVILASVIGAIVAQFLIGEIVTPL